MKQLTATEQPILFVPALLLSGCVIWQGKEYEV